jgi:hypothetical protein
VAKKKNKKNKLTLGQKANYLLFRNPAAISMFLEELTNLPMKTGGYIKCPTKKKKKKPRGVGAALKGYGKALS